MIKDNIGKVRQKIVEICANIKRDPASIQIVCVTKGRSVEEIKQALEAGITDIGENRVQEAQAKYKTLSTIDYRLSTIKWHMIGHLQANKVKEAVRIFDLIQSVDSVVLAQAIDKHALKLNKVQDVLLEVKTSPEETKTGFIPEEAIEAVKKITGLSNVRIKGLMTIAPLVDNPEKARYSFRALREIRDRIEELSTIDYRLSTLSMGMTDDFEIAIEEGATMVRLGRAIFGSGQWK